MAASLASTNLRSELQLLIQAHVSVFLYTVQFQPILDVEILTRTVQKFVRVGYAIAYAISRLWWLLNED
ncbi:MAG: hypothetical protein ACRAVC_05000 [Trichormus sp.]